MATDTFRGMARRLQEDDGLREMSSCLVGGNERLSSSREISKMNNASEELATASVMTRFHPRFSASRSMPFLQSTTKRRHDIAPVSR